MWEYFESTFPTPGPGPCLGPLPGPGLINVLILVLLHDNCCSHEPPC